MKAKLIPLLCVLGLLTACGGDKKDRYDFAQIAGAYQVAFDDASKGPLQVTVYLVDRNNSLLLIRDTRDKLTLSKGTLNETTGAIHFSDGSSCSDKATALGCSINGTSVDIPVITTSATSLVSLAGNYEFVSGGQLYKLTIAGDGKITGTTPCSFSGQLAQNNLPSLNIIQLSDCSGKNVSGVVVQEQVDTKTPVLEVYLPDSDLGGVWILQ